MVPPPEEYNASPSTAEAPERSGPDIFPVGSAAAQFLLAAAGRGVTDETAIQVSVSDRSIDCSFRQAKEAMEPWVPC